MRGLATVVEFHPELIPSVADDGMIDKLFVLMMDKDSTIYVPAHKLVMNFTVTTNSGIIHHML